MFPGNAQVFTGRYKREAELGVNGWDQLLIDFTRE